MRFTDKTWGSGDREFYFPSPCPDSHIAICTYVSFGLTFPPPIVYISGYLADRLVRYKDRYIPAPPEGIRHAAATGDPYPLIDWLLENACADRPWLAEAIGRALAIRT